jgi:hypothetical protein
VTQWKAQEVSMADPRDQEDKLWEVRSKGINYLVIAHGAGLVACLTMVKDIDNAPKLKGLGPVVVRGSVRQRQVSVELLAICSSNLI